jgi:hypothetical protein
MALGDTTHTEKRGEGVMTISSARNGGIGFVLFSRERHGVRADVAFDAANVEAIVDAVRKAAKDAALNEREDASRAQLMTGVRSKL